MAKADMRIVEADEDVMALVDKGVDIDIELKNLTFEDKACKQGITGFVEEKIRDGELGLLIEGNKGVAMVSCVESFKVNAGADSFEEMSRAVKAGLLGTTVTVKRTLAVPPDKIDEAEEVLDKAGIMASVVEEFTVKPADLRQARETRTASADYKSAMEALEECLDRSESFRVKYQAKEG